MPDETQERDRSLIVEESDAPPDATGLAKLDITREAEVVTEQALPPQESARSHYEARLGEIWRAAWGDVAPPDQERERFQRAVVEALDPLDRIGASMLQRMNEQLRNLPIGGVHDLGLDGPFETLMLRATLAAERLGQDPPTLLAFVSGPLAAAIERLDAEGATTPEQRVDLALVCLLSLAQTVPLAKTAAAMTRHLFSQHEREGGFCYTLGTLADLSRQSGDRAQAAFLYHLALRELCRLILQRDVSVIAGQPLARIVDTSATNLAAVLGKRHQDAAGAASAGPRLRQVLFDLAAISAVTAPQPEIASPLAADLIGTATVVGGGSLMRPEAFPVLAELASVPLAWDIDAVSSARLQALGAMALATTERRDRVPTRLFNAGVALLADEVRLTETLARLLLNLAGLVWALEDSDSLLDALLARDGLECAVNFLGALVDAKEHNLTLPPQTDDVAVQIVALTRSSSIRPMLLGTASVDLARVAAAERRLGLASRAEETTMDTLRHSADAGLSAFLGEPVGTSLSDGRLRQLARTVSVAFPRVTNDWAEVVRRVVTVVEERSTPERAIVKHYRRYTLPLEHPFGRTPLRAIKGRAEAAMFNIDELEQLAERLLAPLNSIAPALRELSPERVSNLTGLDDE